MTKESGTGATGNALLFDSAARTSGRMRRPAKRKTTGRNCLWRTHTRAMTQQKTGPRLLRAKLVDFSLVSPRKSFGAALWPIVMS